MSVTLTFTVCWANYTTDLLLNFNSHKKKWAIQVNHPRTDATVRRERRVIQLNHPRNNATEYRIWWTPKQTSSYSQGPSTVPSLHTICLMPCPSASMHLSPTPSWPAEFSRINCKRERNERGGGRSRYVLRLQHCQGWIDAVREVGSYNILIELSIYFFPF